MKQLSVLFGCCIVLSWFWGCHSAGRGVEVIIEGNGKFPEFLVGRWIANRHGWEFVFEPDGTISSAVINFGRITITPGHPNPITREMGGEGMLEPGEWMVYYSQPDRELTVKISIKKLYMVFDINDNVVEGKSEDVFVGTISQDGSFWQANWIGSPDYTVYTAGQLNENLTRRLSSDMAVNLTFEKLTPD